jgi:hypothetical protein
MHGYAWYVWRKTPRSGPSLRVSVGKSEAIAALSAVELPKVMAETRPVRARQTAHLAYSHS